MRTAYPYSVRLQIGTCHLGMGLLEVHNEVDQMAFNWLAASIFCDSSGPAVSPKAGDTLAGT